MPDAAVVEGVAVDVRHWIGGRRVASSRTFADVCPIDEQPLAEVAAGGAAEVGQAVAAAEQAFPRWAATGPNAASPEGWGTPGVVGALAGALRGRVRDQA